MHLQNPHAMNCTYNMFVLQHGGPCKGKATCKVVLPGKVLLQDGVGKNDKMSQSRDSMIHPMHPTGKVTIPPVTIRGECRVLTIGGRL